jgi:hypothetical protein
MVNADIVKYGYGTIVYKLVDDEEKGMVTGILFRPNHIVYYVTWPSGEQPHFEIELTTEQSFSTKKP